MEYLVTLGIADAEEAPELDVLGVAGGSELLTNWLNWTRSGRNLAARFSFE